MKIALCSDLHLEFKDIELFNTEGAEVLVLAGDIMIAECMHQYEAPPTVTSPYEPYKQLGHNALMAIRFRGFLERVSKEFPHVVYVAGNHEFYDGKFVRALKTLKEECDRFPNVYFMERDLKEIGEVTFVGATLWTNCNKGDPLTLYHLQTMMNDYRIIVNDEVGFTKLRPAHTAERHRQTMGYFKNVIDDRKDKKIIVVGHHSPSFQSQHPKYANDQLMNGGYHSDLEQFIMDRPQIKLWVHGHTHESFDYMIEGTRVVCNPRGYAGYEETAIDYKVKFLDI